MFLIRGMYAIEDACLHWWAPVSWTSL